MNNIHKKGKKSTQIQLHFTHSLAFTPVTSENIT